MNNSCVSVLTIMPFNTLISYLQTSIPDSLFNSIGKTTYRSLGAHSLIPHNPNLSKEGLPFFCKRAHLNCKDTTKPKKFMFNKIAEFLLQFKNKDMQNAFPPNEK